MPHDPYQLVLLGGMVLLLGLLLAAWGKVLWGVGRPGWRGLIGHWTIQLWGILGLLGLVSAGGTGLLAAAVAPIPYLILISYFMLPFWSFAIVVLPVPVALAGLVFWLLFRHPTTRKASFGVSLLTLMLVTLPAAELASQATMCRTAGAQGLTELRRNSFNWSLENTPDEFQFEIHGTARLGDRRFGWSYREMGWYEIPPDAWGDVEAPVFDCGTLTGVSS